jgi:peptidyl-prolyl cis-trans isomerase SurA
MRRFSPIRFAVLLLLPFAAATYAQDAAPVVLDKVVAVVNKRVILASDLDDEIRLSVLDASQVGQGDLTREHALEQLISRTLVEQQIGTEDEEAVQPAPEDVTARVDDLRRELPECVHSQCASEPGWKAFLATHGLTEERVEEYLRYRLEILRFIEVRFRPGIRISPADIETYYHQTLVPQYKAGEAVPPLERVGPRIEEILLERQVNSMFDQWLDNLRKQGNVEVVDPDLQSAVAEPGGAQ